MTLYIFGPTASGKDTYGHLLEKKRNAKKLTSYTTRPVRQGELYGEEYFFINDEIFDYLYEQGKIRDVRSFPGGEEGEVWRYGFPSSLPLFPVTDSLTYAIVDVGFLLSHPEVIGASVLVWAPVETRRERYIQRGSAQSFEDRNILDESDLSRLWQYLSRHPEVCPPKTYISI